MRETIKNLKEQLKNWGTEIRLYKNRRKQDNRGELALWQIETIIKDLKYEFRHHHIFYCELRGRKREQIEIPSEYNQPNQKYIDKIKENILKHIESETSTHDETPLCAVA